MLFRPIFSSLTRSVDSLYIEKWKSKGLNDESQLTAVKNSSSKDPNMVSSSDGKISIKFNDGNYFKQENVDYTRSNAINIYIVYKLTPRTIIEEGIIQVNGLFGNLTRNTKDALHYRYYDSVEVFFDTTGSYGGTGINALRNLILHGTDMKTSSYATNKKHHIYILGKSFTQGLQYGATIYAEYDYDKVNGSQVNVKFVLSVHYNGDNSYLFINGVQKIKFKAMDSLNLKNPLVVGNTSNNFPNNTDYKKAALHGEIYNFLVSYEATDIKKYMTLTDI